MANKRQFDENEVLSTIAEHFWKHGYAATKVDQLSEITGLTKTSLYNAFGNKESLFLRAIDFYVQHNMNLVMQHVDINKSMSTNLEKILHFSFLEENNVQLAYGCLLTNSILELAANEPKLFKEVSARIAQCRNAMQKFFSHYVKTEQVVANYEADDLTYLFMTFFQGLRVQSRNHNSADVLKRSISTFLNLMRSFESNNRT